MIIRVSIFGGSLDTRVWLLLSQVHSYAYGSLRRRVQGEVWGVSVACRTCGVDWSVRTLRALGSLRALRRLLLLLLLLVLR